MAPATDELIARVNAVDVAALEAAARALDTAAEQMASHARQVTGIVSGTLPHWQGDAAGRWLEFFTMPTANLRMATWPLNEMAGALREIAAEAEQAKGRITAAQDELGAIYMNPTDLDARARADRLIEGSANSYHAAEQRVREKLWRIGDLAPYPLPPPGPPQLSPRTSWWEDLLGPNTQPVYAGEDGYHNVGEDGKVYGAEEGEKLYGVDEDGRSVPAHHGGPIELELEEAGLSGLIRLIPRVAGRLPANPTVKQVAKAFADDIVKSKKWSTGRIDKHIEEWFGLPRGSTLTQKQRDEFLELVSKAAASDTPVFKSFVSGSKTYAKLQRDPATGKWLVVHFYKSNGEFASAYAPTRKQLDALMRQAATGR
jgi:hypothetical protein